MRVFLKKIFVWGFFLLFLIFLSKKVDAGYFRFDPSTINSPTGNNFEVKVILEPGNDQIYSTDIYINYDSSLLKVVNVKAENLFPTVSYDTSTNGRIYIAAMVNDPTSFISSAGAVATITFQGLKNESGSLSFDCGNSKIIKNDTNATNVLNCSQNNNASITIGGSSSSNGQENNDNSNSLPKSLPQSGIFDNTIKIGIPGILLILIGTFFLKVFT